MKPTLTRGLQVLFRHWWVIVVFCVVTMSLVMTASYVLPPVFGATAKLLVIPGNEQLPIFTLSSTVADRATGTQLQTEDILSEIELIQSRPIIERVVARLGLDHRNAVELGDPPRPPEKQSWLHDIWTEANANFHQHLVDLELVTVVSDREKAIDALRNTLKLKPVRSSNVFTVYYQDKSPKLAAAVVNTLVEEYLVYRRDVYKPVGVVEHFREKLEEQKADLKATKERLRAFEEKDNITNLEIETETTLKLYEEAKRAGPFNQQLDQYARRLTVLRNDAPTIHDLRFDVENSQNLYERYAQKYEEVSSNAELSDAKFANVRVIEPASVDEAPTFPHRFLNLILSLILGLLGGVGLAFVMNYFSSKLNTVEDVEAAGIPALGSVPFLARRSKRKLAFAAEHVPAFTVIAEQLRGGGERTGFVVSGAGPRVGCSTMTAALALGLAMKSGRRVLVVDADPRPRRLHQMLKLAKPSAREPLAEGPEGLSELIRPTGYGNLDILSIASTRSQPDSVSLRNLLDAASGHYDVIIVDAPPLMSSATVFALARERTGWGVVLVVEAGRTGSEVARRAIQLLQRQGIALFGAVLNKRENSVPGFIYQRL